MKTNKLFCMGLLFLLAIGLTGCEDDEVEGGLKYDFYLENSQGERTTVFKEGEDISFVLRILNNTEDYIVLPNFMNIMDRKIFTVYSEDGKEIGRPWDTYTGPFTNVTVVSTDRGQVVRCNWLTVLEHGNSYIYFGQEQERSPLPIGRYYSQFTVTDGNNKSILCRVDFEIK